MKVFPFAAAQGIGAAGNPSTAEITSMYGRKVNLRGFQLFCPALGTVTGPATLAITGVTDSTQPGGGVGNGQLTFMFTPSTTEITTVTLEFAEGCVESPAAMSFTLTPNGSDSLSNSLISYWGQLVPAGE